jgi:hypothetical protein
MVVLTNPSLGETEAFERWYNDKHLVDIAAMETVVSATRYRIVHEVPVSPAIPGDSRQSLAIYEIEAETEEDLRRTAEIMSQCMEAGTVDLSPTLDLATASAYFAIQVSDRVSRG